MISTSAEQTKREVEREMEECGASKEAFNLAVIITLLVTMSSSGVSFAKALGSSARMIDEHVKKEVTKARDGRNSKATMAVDLAAGKSPVAGFSYFNMPAVFEQCNCPECVEDRKNSR